MISFESDYIAGAHPRILERLIETNLESLPGYGSDIYCKSAEQKIKSACGIKDGSVYFISGGTQTNAIVVSAMLKPFEGVISCKTGHIEAHEAGAVENTGVKVLDIEGKNGKIVPSVLKQYVADFYADANHEHMVFPGMVYVSHPTEYGTLYTKEELTEISDICKQYNMKLFLDGARLGYGLQSYNTNLSLPQIAALCDVFYIGGTKVGALCGEAVVFTRDNTPAHFINFIKKKGALLAKGRLLGVQFDTLFTDNLYFDIARHAIDLSEDLKAIFIEKGYKFFIDSPTNQQFVILENSKMAELQSKVRFGFWEKYDETHTVVRFATSWSTTKEDLEYLKNLL